MKAKRAIKIGVDLAMTALFLCQMGYHMMDNRAHEWLGIALCLLFILHHALNGEWHRALFRGKYSAQRILLTAVDILLVLSMAAVIVSSVMVSRHAFSFLGLHLRGLGRQPHRPATMWAFVLVGLHLGLHWSMVLNDVRKKTKRKAGKAAAAALYVLLVLAVGFGAYQFVHRGLWMELFRLREFAFLDYGETLPYFLLSYMAILALWTAGSYYLSKLLKNRKKSVKSA